MYTYTLINFVVVEKWASLNIFGRLLIFFASAAAAAATARLVIIIIWERERERERGKGKGENSTLNYLVYSFSYSMTVVISRFISYTIFIPKNWLLFS